MVADAEVFLHDTMAADAVLVAAGPWTPEVVDPGGGWAPIRATWGVTVQLRLADDTPRHIVEEDEVDAINRADAASERALARGRGRSTVAVHPRQRRRCEHARVDVPARRAGPGLRIAELLLRRAITWLPAIEDAEVLERRICARPQSIDGRPFIGPLRGG